MDEWKRLQRKEKCKKNVRKGDANTSWRPLAAIGSLEVQGLLASLFRFAVQSMGIGGFICKKSFYFLSNFLKPAPFGLALKRGEGGPCPLWPWNNEFFRKITGHGFF